MDQKLLNSIEELDYYQIDSFYYKDEKAKLLKQVKKQISAREVINKILNSGLISHLDVFTKEENRYYDFQGAYFQLICAAIMNLEKVDIETQKKYMEDIKKIELNKIEIDETFYDKFNYNLKETRKLLCIIHDAMTLCNKDYNTKYKSKHTKKLVIAALDLKEYVDYVIARRCYDYFKTVKDQLPKDMVISKAYTKEELDFLIKQYQIFNNLKNMDIPIEQPTIENGKVIVSQGDLIHGIGRYNEEKLISISQTGILSGEFIGIHEDGETYGCADFFKSTATCTVDKLLSTIDDTTGRIPRGHQYRQGSRSIAFIISPKEELKPLTDYDPYKKGTEKGDYMRKVVNEAGLPIPKNGSSIVVGIPSEFISKIIVGDEVNKINEIHQIFPKCTIVSTEGKALIEPLKKGTQEKNNKNL